VSALLKRDPIEDLLGVDITAQTLIQTKSFKVPAELLDPGSSLYGLSIHLIQDAKGRPRLVVLLLIGA
jgi:hypothetical protein